MLCFVFAVLVVLLDQFIKRWVLLTLAVYERMDLIPGVVGLTNIENTGAAFSILSDQRWLLIGIAVIAALLLIAILLRYNDGFWSTLGLAAVLGGTIGNLADRLLLGYVIDIFELQFMHFAIFNIADVFITLGGITFLINFIVTSLRPSRGDDRIYDGAQVEYTSVERPYVDEQIGLYDFQYGEDSPPREQYEYDDYSDDGAVSEQYPENDPEAAADYSESDVKIYSAEESDNLMSAIDALGDLELDLLDTDGELGDYDIDELLREYGFEDDKDQLF